MSSPKPYEIPKAVVWESFKSVKSNGGAAGVDNQSIADFEEDVKNNLYKLWNRMSSGSYFPTPVKAVEIPKKDGGTRTLGIPTVTDRIAQTVVAKTLEKRVEAIFHPDSYGYRKGRSAHDAIGTCRQRCWQNNWVVDLDIKSFFDTVPHDLVMKAVARQTNQKWVLLYVQRWLEAPMQRQDGTQEQRDRGTPQGSAISPLLANLFMHYVFDLWIQKEFPDATFERYCDDVVVHCRNEMRARRIKQRITERLAEMGMELHPHKTRIVYCKDGDRKGSYEHEAFDFLGYTFRARRVKSKDGNYFVGFTPAIATTAKKAINREIRSWHIPRRSDKSLNDLAMMFNPIIRGWINYYGRFYRSMMIPLLKHLNQRLVLWAMRKFKRLARHKRRAIRWLVAVAKRQPNLFAHWSVVKPEGWTVGAG
jgi:RNA-directed DNA polymerase